MPHLLAMLQYLQKFIPHLADKVDLLRNLLKQGTVWLWAEEQSATLQTIQRDLKEAPTMQYYDINKERPLVQEAPRQSL